MTSNQRVMPMMTGQSQSGPAIPWYLAEIVYEGYAALYGRSQTIERMAERGGFGWGEVAIIFMEKRDRTLWASLLTRAAAGVSVETTAVPYLDSVRLEWLFRNISGAEWRRLGIEYSGRMNRTHLNDAMAAEHLKTPGAGT